jgi:hypothetical protein
VPEHGVDGLARGSPETVLLVRHPLDLLEETLLRISEAGIINAAYRFVVLSNSPRSASSGTFNVLTTPHANAWTSRHPPRHSPNSYQPLHFKRESTSAVTEVLQHLTFAMVRDNHITGSSLQFDPHNWILPRRTKLAIRAANVTGAGMCLVSG